MITRVIVYTSLSILFLGFIQCNSKKKQKLPQNNAIWAESLYFRGFKPTGGENLTEAHIERYAHTLKKNNVKYVFIFSGPYGTDGHLPAYAFSDIAINSVERFKHYYPEIIILPWIGGIQNKTVYLEDSLWVKNALADTEKIVRALNVPGVHVDFEYILAGEPSLDATIQKEKPGDLESYGNNVNNFLAQLRTLLPKSFISTVVAATSPGIKPWKRKTSMEELQVMIQHIDQLLFLFYDTSINDQKKFEDNCEHLLHDIQHLKSLNPQHPVQYLVAIGTFINSPDLHKYRNLTIESIPNTLLTLKKSSMKITDTISIVDGIGLYCDWQTDEDEWEEFYEHWASY
jgi:hypothetical protein